MSQTVINEPHQFTNPCCLIFTYYTADVIANLAETLIYDIMIVILLQALFLSTAGDHRQKFADLPPANFCAPRVCTEFLLSTSTEFFTLKNLLFDNVLL